MTTPELAQPLILAYLDRLGLASSPASDRAGLDLLVTQHLHRVPFENIDVQRRRPIRLDTPALVEKVVFQRRGGFCFEVNEAFRALLASLGFRVHRIEGQVWNEAAGAFGAPFDHLALVVELDGAPLLVDVGFGDNSRLPMRLPDGSHSDLSGDYELEGDDAGGLLRRVGGGAVRPLYRFTRTPQPLAAFEAMCRYHQTSPDSIFTQGLICSMATREGRISLAKDRLIVAERGVRREEALPDPVARNQALADHFGVIVD